MDLTAFDTIRVRFDGPVCYLQLYRPDARNTINAQMIAECNQVLDACEMAPVSVIVLQGLPGIFCFGADFSGLRDDALEGREDASSAGALYDMWSKLAAGPYVTVAHVRGSVNAGGMGFVAASDIVIAEPSVRFSLSELLFGLYPACVMPFLIRRIGLQKANYLTLSTLPIGAEEACRWGLVDRVGEDSETLLQRHLQRLGKLRKDSVAMYKHYLARLPATLPAARDAAVANNQAMHHLPGVVEGIMRFVESGRLPWEGD